MKRKMIKVSFALLMVFVLLISPAMTFAQNAQDQKLNYLALGDSLAAGLTPDRQIGKGYPDYLASQLSKVGMLERFDRQFTVPGYKTADILNDIETNAAKQGSDGNIVDITSAITYADIITIDAGANDLLKQLTIDPKTGAITYDQAKIQESLTSVGTNLAAIFTKIRALNGDADIYVMGYYNPFPILPEQSKAQVTVLLNALNGAILNTGSPFNAVFVPTGDAIAKNPLAYLPNPQDIHPNQGGYLVLANEFWKVLDVGKNTTFNDEIPLWAVEEVQFLTSKGVINGYPSGDFGGEDPISRVQSAIMLNRAIIYNGEAATNIGYADVNETTYGYDAIAKLTKEGVFTGYNQQFAPERSLTRAEMARILVTAFHLSGSSAQTFKDVSDLHWASGYIKTLKENKITNGFPDGSFKPDELITRAEFSVMLARALDSSFIEG